MFPVKISKSNLDEYSRCEELSQIKNTNPVQKTDMVLTQLIHHALWADDVLRMLDYREIDVYVKNGIVHLYGHIVSTNSQGRINKAIQTIPGVLGIKNNLVMDDTLTLDVATSLSALEHAYRCKFFTGASHGVISLNGTVINQHVKLLAVKCAAANPNVRGVINNIHASGEETGSNHHIFMQPMLGENIYFLDGVSGIVQKVIIDPNNRLVIAMTVLGRFTSQQTHGGELTLERLIVLRMSAVRYLTKESGFLYIRSDQTDRYMDFDSTGFATPNKTWTPPYPYCTNDVLFPVACQEVDVQDDEVLRQYLFEHVTEDPSLKGQFYAHDSFGV